MSFSCSRNDQSISMFGTFVPSSLIAFYSYLTGHTTVVLHHDRSVRFNLFICTTANVATSTILSSMYITYCPFKWSTSYPKRGDLPFRYHASKIIDSSHWMGSVWGGSCKIIRWPWQWLVQTQLLFLDCLI